MTQKDQKRQTEPEEEAKKTRDRKEYLNKYNQLNKNKIKEQKENEKKKT